VLGDLGELDDVAKLGRLAQLALADRARVGVGQRHQPVGDLLPRQPLCDLLGPIGQALQPPRGRELGPGVATTRLDRGLGGQRAGLAHRRAHQLAGLAGQPQHRGLNLATAPRDRPADQPQPPGRRPRAITHRRASSPTSLATRLPSAAEHARRVDRQTGIRR
jgi:hypothetical protein